MVDISKCTGEKCKKKETCYRYLAKGDELWQSYFASPNPKKCSAYWEVSKDQVKKLDRINEW